MHEPRDASALLKAVATVIREHVSNAVTAFVERVEKIEKALNELPVPKDGKDGLDGKSVTADELQPLVDQAVAASVAALPPAKDGKDGQDGVDGLDGKSVTLDDLIPTVKEWFEELPRPVDGKDGKDGVDGKSVTLEDVQPVLDAAIGQMPRPRDGVDGKSVTADEILPTVREWFDAIPRPTNGKDGIDGKSVTLDDVRELIEPLFAKWQLDWERRAMDVNQRCLDRFEKPKDGRNGVDGLGFDDLSVSFDGRRTVTLRFEKGEQVKEFPIKFATLLETGVWLHGKEYEQGDGVTCGGNYWIALKDTSARPGENNNDWRLAVRKGRDGKSAETAPRFAGAAR